jgi:hypothetical protein
MHRFGISKGDIVDLIAIAMGSSKWRPSMVCFLLVIA